MKKIILSNFIFLSFLGSFQGRGSTHFSSLEKPKELSEESWERYKLLHTELKEEVKKNHKSWGGVLTALSFNMSGLSFQELAKTGQYKRASDLYRDLNKLYLFLEYPKSTNEEFAFHSAEELEDFILLVLKNKMYHFNKINRDNCNEEAKFLAKINFFFQEEERIKLAKEKIAREEQKHKDAAKFALSAL